MTIALRPETTADEPFLRHLIVETVALELGASAWPEPLRGPLLDLQYKGRRGARPGWIVQTDGVDAGWVVLSDNSDHVFLTEIMILPEMRGRGIGTAALRFILTNARKPVRLHVNVTNLGAVRLYERLGFRRVAGNEIQHLMEAAEIIPGAPPPASRNT